MFKLTVTLLGSFLFVNTAVASVWKESNDKGLFIYTIISSNPDSKLTLVCDPEQLWAAPDEGLKAQNYLNIEHNGTIIDGGSITLSKGSLSETFTLSAGSLFPENPKQWNKLISELQTTGDLKIDGSNIKLSVTIDKPISLNCNINEDAN